ncbi:heterokaryon incompatibility protein het-E-1 [Apiospora rasikravindrae]|uniref:Heterokaryon incompatibility protein het-E-1 n=1 Tax=Apiospora rasikravindrae TaxID=990691 RepID=A0ABR1RQR5_9PEZI
MPIRLINTETLLLESFNTPPPYAILSHTWGPEEVSLQEWEVVHDSGAIQGQCPHIQKKSRPNVEQKEGCEKVKGACKQAARDGIQYLWCDTNCIDKTSSAELSEAINSMFAWYRNSKVCYAILTDVEVPKATSLRDHKSNTEGWFMRYQNTKSQNIDVWNDFQNSRWWTRGWTLQELLAPKNVVFFASDWSPLGSKAGLSEWILSFTTIHRQALQDASSIHTFSIAQRMSWAADRKTTVPEDMAYCLLGIFNVNMPMLYGQGCSQAFFKLQEEIIKESDDQSILAWDYTSDALNNWGSALAPSPVQFRACGSLGRDDSSQRVPYSITNHGISMLSKMSLDTGYLMATKLRDTDLYITLQPSRFPGTRLPLLATLTPSQNPDLFSSGFLVQFGSGDMSPTGVFRNASAMDPIITATLQPRRRSSISHQAIWGQGFSLLLSISWDRHCHIQSWHTTVLNDPERLIINKWLHDPECLALERRTICEAPDADGPTRMIQIHRWISEKNTKANGDHVPLVDCSREVLEDCHSQQELVLSVVFRPPGH